jgi:hypothetical protein
LWGTSSQRPYNLWHFTYWLNSGGDIDDKCCCHLIQYNLLDDWWSEIIIY